MIMILLKSLGKRTSIGSYYDEKSLTKCYWDGVFWLFVWGFKLLCDKYNCLCYYKNDISENDFFGNESIFIFFYPYTSYNGNEYLHS